MMITRRFALTTFALVAGYRSRNVFAQAASVAVQSGTFRSTQFQLQNGNTLPEMVIAYETYGKLAPDGRNAVLLSHGFTSSHRMAGRSTEGDAGGSWDGLVGAGKAIDTDKLFVVSANHLGSCFGSTGPAHVNPATGKRYGPDFPAITINDMVNAQKVLLDSLGVKRLVAVVAPSYGGRHVFQWGVNYPDFMDGLVPIAIAPTDPRGPAGVQALVNELAKDPNWNGGWYYDKGGIPTVLTAMRVATLKNYGIEEQLAASIPDKAQREAEIARKAGEWVKQFDGNSLVVLRRASVGFDTEKDFARVKAKLLYVLSRTDRSYPPSLAPGVMSKLKAAGVAADYFEIDSELGHSAIELDAAKWAPRLRAFMTELQERR
jgi:homoserine O-acetyltransferase